MHDHDTTVQSPPPAGYDDGTIDAFLLELGARQHLQRSDAARMGLLLVECGLAEWTFGDVLRTLRASRGYIGRVRTRKAA